LGKGFLGFWCSFSAAVWPKLTWRQTRFSDVHLEADVLLIAALLQDVQIDEFPARDWGAWISLAYHGLEGGVVCVVFEV